MHPDETHPTEAEYLEEISLATEKLKDLLYGPWPNDLEGVKERYAVITETAENLYAAADELSFWYGN